MNTSRPPVYSCVIEVDVLDSQAAFHEVNTDVLHLRGKPYNSVLVL